MGEIRSKAATRAYRDNFDRIFKSRKKKVSRAEYRRIRRILLKNEIIDE